MELVNKTHLRGIEEKMRELVEGYSCTENLQVKVKYTKENARAPYSGICYYTKDKIRVSINPHNKYPIKINVGSPFNKKAWEHYHLNSPEELTLFVFLHEISHYLDYKNGLSVRCKQTKADKFALWKMGKI